MIDAAGQADAGAFLVRLLRLDPAALVRLRPVRAAAGADIAQAAVAADVAQAAVAADIAQAAVAAEMWAMLPFGVLVMRALPVRLDSDRTVAASELLETLRMIDSPVTPKRRDEAWRWPLPSSRGRAVEVVPAAEVARVAAAASRTLRDASRQGVAGRAVGERVIRDALLDHIPIVVTGYHGEHVDVPQRMVQAVVRMGFLGDTSEDAPRSVTCGDNLVTVRLAAGWIGLDASYGCAWYRPSSPMRMT